LNACLFIGYLTLKDGTTMPYKNVGDQSSRRNRALKDN